MNRIEAVAGIGVIALVAAGLGPKYAELSKLAQTPDPEKPSRAQIAAAKPQAAGLDAAVNAFLASSETATDTDRLVHLGEFMSAIGEPSLAAQDVDAAKLEPFAKAIVDALEQSPDYSKEGMDLRRRAVGLLASRVGTPTSKAYVLKVMDEGPQELREEAVARVGGPRGVRGASVYAKVYELAVKGLVPDEILPQALRRTGGLKAREALVTLLKSTDSAKLVDGCAVALQDYRDPTAIADVLERLEQLGRLDSGGRMPWISASLLDAHMKTADRAQFRRGVMAMAARPSLTKIEHLKTALDSTDPDTRKIAAEAVKKAVVAKVVDAETGEAMLAGRLQSETEPVLKAELTGGLERVRSLLPQKATQQ